MLAHLCQTNDLHVLTLEEPKIQTIASPQYGRYAAVTMQGVPVHALVDSGNIWRTVISPRFLKKLGISQDSLRPLKITTIATAKEGAHLRLLGETPQPLMLQFAGLEKNFPVRPVVVQGLSMDLNLSGPFLHRYRIDQLHSTGCLRVENRTIPLRAAPDDRDGTFQPGVHALYTAQTTTLPPWSTQYLLTRPGNHALGTQKDWFVEGEEEFMDKTDAHPTLGAIVQKEANNLFYVPIMNTTDEPLTIRRGTRYGSATPLSPPPKVAAMTRSTDNSSRALRRAPTPGPEELQWARKEFKLDQTPCLPDEPSRIKAASLLAEYKDVFSLDGSFGKTHLLQHEIHTEPGPPIKVRYRHPNPTLEPALDAQLAEWTKHDVIEPSQSPWSFAMVAVRKKNGKIRWCVDYRPLNAITKKDSFPLPHIEDNLARLANSKIFSGIDGSGAFHVIEIAKKDRPKTAFSTPRGLFQFKRMPFGLTNGPATYSRLVQLVLQGIPPEVAIPYLDDTIIHSPDLDQHCAGLRRVLQAHRKAGLKLQPAKCQLFQKEIEYLGHLVSEAGIQPMKKYVEVVQRWPLPTNQSEARAFLGKVSYYRRFIRDFSSIARPWTAVTGKEKDKGKNQPIVVTDEMKASFAHLKRKLLEAPILAYPRFHSSKPFILDTDWSYENKCIGGALSQEQDGQERAICYGAKKLSKSQSNYPPTKGELFAAIFFMKYWKYYLLFRPFILRTDHQSLKWIYTMDAPSGLTARWLEILSNFVFTVQHRAGKKHANADALSRISHADPPDPSSDDDAEAPAISTLQLHLPDPQLRAGFRRLRQYQDQDPVLCQVKKLVHSSKRGDNFPMGVDVRTKFAKHGSAVIEYLEYWYALKVDHRGLLRFNREATGDDSGDYRCRKNWVPCIPPPLQQSIIEGVHLTLGHAGVARTLAALQDIAHFPAMHARVRDFVKGCQTCQRQSCWQMLEQQVKAILLFF